MKSPNFTGLLTLQALATINRLYFVLQAEQITVIGNEMSVQTSRFSNIWSKIKQLWVIVAHLKLWVAVATHNFKGSKI